MEARGQSDRTGNSVKALLSPAEAVLDSANSRNYGSSLRHARDASYHEAQHPWHGQGLARCGALRGNLTRRCTSRRVLPAYSSGPLCTETAHLLLLQLNGPLLLHKFPTVIYRNSPKLLLPWR